MNEFATWMKTYVTVSDLESFSRAADVLGITQSTVSRQINALEKHLGASLLKRTTRSFALTVEGVSFYDAALRALAAIDEAEAAVRSPEALSGVVRLTAPLTLARARIIPYLAQFQRAHPDLHIEVQLSDHALNLVADRLDFAIRVGEIGDSRNRARKVGTARRVAVASPDYLERAGVPQTPADLRSHNCIAFALLSTGNTWQFAGHDPVSISGSFRTDSSDALRSAALCGLGIAVNARWLFEEDLAAGRLVELLADYPPVDMPISIVLPPSRYTATRVRALVDHIASCIQADPLLRSD
ncbi:LysR family transcriptional regulator [Novosphingobium taihuense]|uniref:DNA-binding transcriptional LysR family regulator n=1 Tax=Novosphingobium taihuense TaxID=260085 RepID=A0A7W7AB50_9SPHN|nr:LysR family transcriptional regulator [Novosphingobium taihuense]MBB4613020.1 DNA-binding transcriptional LysR family regulator [Novosphingobium taihuense]TWH85164.1 LysR family transcriptional regulator [Novosphingobium taihuense]